MNQHFIQRVRERLPEHPDPTALHCQVHDMIHAALTKGDLPDIERVMPCRQPQRSIWRVILPEGIIYVVACDVSGAPITLLTQEHVRAAKDVRRGRASGVREANMRRLLARCAEKPGGPKSEKWRARPGRRG